MRTILKKGKLKSLLDEVAIRVLHRGECDTKERPWHVVFSCGYYDEYNTAFYELQGSPVKARVIVDISEMDFSRDDNKSLQSVQGTVLVISSTMDFRKRFYVRLGENGRYANILKETKELKNQLSKNKEK